eukprot:gene38728-47085_t
MLSWSSSTITCRTPAASSYTSRQPTASPSAAPSFLPSVVPSVAPSEYPSQLPSFIPSESPSPLPSIYVEPTFSPSYQNDEEGDQPTFSPSYDNDVEGDQPTFAPTQSVEAEESLAPIVTAQMFAVEQNERDESALDHIILGTNKDELKQRRLQNYVTNDNSHSVLVDGIGADDVSTSQYRYDDHETPKVISIDPLFISSASSTNITIYGQLLAQAGVVVTVGEQVCEHVQAVTAGYGPSGESQDVVSCVLKRLPSFGRAATVTVRVYVPNKGYAAMQSDVLSLPVVYRGFEIAQISPMKGSVMGGNVLNITGFGFLASDASRHTITLSQVGLQGLSEYDAMLLALGFNASTTYKDSERFSCVPMESSLYHVLCLIPAHVDSMYNDTDYDVKVTLNGIDAVCNVAGDANCTYSQLFDETPVLTQTAILDVSADGEFLVDVSISRGNPLPVGYEVVEVLVANKLCSVVNSSSVTKQPSQTNDFMTIQTPSLPGGRHTVNATFRSIGAAYTTSTLAFIQVDSIIRTVDFAASEGSLAGGTTVTITGQGFAEDCAKLTVSFNTTYLNSAQLISAIELLSCSTTRVVLKTPSVLWYFGSSKKTTFDEAQLQVLVSGVVLKAGTADQVSFAVAATDFQYTYWMTPRVMTGFVSGASNAVQGSLMSIQVISRDSSLLAKANNTGYAVMIGGKSCDYNGAVNPSPSQSSSGNGLILYSYLCILPPLAGSSTPYPVYVDVESAGYAIDNRTSNFFLPLYTSPFLPRTFLSMFGSDELSSSVYGGRRLTLQGQGFADSTFVTVCEKPCKTTGTTSYSSLTCELPD